MTARIEPVDVSRTGVHCRVISADPPREAVIAWWQLREAARADLPDPHGIGEVYRAAPRPAGLHGADVQPGHGDAPSPEPGRGGDDRAGRHTVALYNPTAPDGGVVLVTFTHEGQRPHRTVHYTEDWCGGVRRLPHASGYLDIKAAAERIWRAYMDANRSPTPGLDESSPLSLNDLERT